MSLVKRLRLYGKPASKLQIATEVASLLIGKPDQKIPPMGATAIAKELDFNSIKTVYNYRDFAVENNLLEVNQAGVPIIPEIKGELDFEKFDELHPFVKDGFVSEWRQDLLFRKNGEPLASWKNYVRCLEIVCNTLGKNPSRFLRSLDESEKMLKNFLEIYRTGKAQMKYLTDPDHVDMKNIAYTFSKGIRDFMNYNNLRYPKGKQGVMSQKVPNHGKYADIRLSDEEITRGFEYFKEKYGLDSDEYRFLSIGIESCSRPTTLFNTTLDYVKHTSKKTGKSTYILTVYESKTKHIKGGKWKKYITMIDTQKSIDLLKSRGCNKIYESTELPSIVERKLRAAILDLWVYLGKITNIEELEVKKLAKIRNTGNYWFDHTLHSLRHIGAHYWLRKKSYNYGLVAVIGGWNTIDELKNSYGEMPPEVILQLLEDEA